MKFFTYEWWKSLQCSGPHDDPSIDYRLHLGRIRSRLTPELLRVEEGLSLHDGVLRGLWLDVASGQIKVNIDLDDWDRPSCAVEFRYEGVSRFESTSPGRGDHLGGPIGFGHLGYFETDVNEQGFEHRILFSSGIELRIVFSGFHFRFAGNAGDGNV
jgi:hypothetical protein